MTTRVSSSAPAAVAPVAVPEQLRFAAKTVDGPDFAGQSLVGKPTVLSSPEPDPYPWPFRVAAIPIVPRQGELRLCRSHDGTLCFVGQFTVSGLAVDAS